MKIGKNQTLNRSFSLTNLVSMHEKYFQKIPFDKKFNHLSKAILYNIFQALVDLVEFSKDLIAYWINPLISFSLRPYNMMSLLSF